MYIYSIFLQILTFYHRCINGKLQIEGFSRLLIGFDHLESLYIRIYQSNSDLSPIGSTKWADSGGTVNVPSETEKVLASVSVPAGTWIAKGSVNYQSESSAGSRMVQLRQSNANIGSQEVQGNANGWTQLTVTDVIALAVTTTVSVIAKQSSGGTIQCQGFLALVRIK